MINDKIMDIIMKGNLKEIWNLFTSPYIKDGYDNYDKDLEIVRNGKFIKFDIFDLWNSDGKQIMVKNKIGKIIIDKKMYDIKDYRDEKEKRREIMVCGIYEVLENTDKTMKR